MIGIPYRVTRSYARTAPAFFSQCGSLYVFLIRWPASGSTHSGSILAFTRAQSREVSTSSADITQRGGFLNSPDPGKTANRAPRAPPYSRFSTSYRPRCESRPESSD